MAHEEEIEISEDGVVIHNLEIDDPALSEYLSSLEDPAEGIRDLINIAFEVRSRFTMDLETQNIKDSADAVCTVEYLNLIKWKNQHKIAK